MADGLVKFMSQSSDNGNGRLFWGRAHVDGAPFRGEPSILTEDEYEARKSKVGDPHNNTFDLNEPSENAAYLGVLNMIVNKWATLLHIERMITVEHKKVYIEWIQWFFEDGGGTPHAPPGLSDYPAQ